MTALHKIVLDPKGLDNLHIYIQFQHAGELENFNSMMTKYAPKKNGIQVPILYTENYIGSNRSQLSSVPKAKAESRGGTCQSLEIFQKDAVIPC
ncbi:unnamed protein product [Pocillopora meandrina]|uniref:Uncharacterized protein n=1 Tax=Pocillopora meandrina TaxID=46732 RepID=A0AAU9VWN7_9CNID|nr:unnamed protein product [Pocillopora meandrina]